MAMTMRAVLDALNSVNGKELDEIVRDELVRMVARAAHEAPCRPRARIGGANQLTPPTVSTAISPPPWA